LLQTGSKQKEIARIVGTSESIISREIKRNSSKRTYSARMAQDFAEERKVRYCRVRKFTPEIEKRVRYLMEEEQWSPEQIVGWCKKEGLPTVSYERIYQYVRQDKQDGGTLYKHCRNRLKHRKRPVGGKMMLPYKKFVISITSDNGCEFYEHKMIAKKLQTDYFFAHPYSS